MFGSRIDRHAAIIGVDSRTYPTGRTARCGWTLPSATLSARRPLPTPLPMAAIDDFLAQASTWIWRLFASAGLSAAPVAGSGRDRVLRYGLGRNVGVLVAVLGEEQVKHVQW
jgi:hypothetical protein